MNNAKPPVALVLLSFLCIEPTRAAGLFDIAIPTRRGVWRNPLSQLLNALGVYWEYFFDYYPCNGAAHDVRESFRHHLGRIGLESLDSREDFISNNEWAQLRSSAADILRIAGVTPLPKPYPLTFDEWIDVRLDRDSYDEYVDYMRRVCPHTPVMSYE